MGPKYNHKKDVKGDLTQTEERRQCDHVGKKQSHIADTKECQEPPEVKRGKEMFSPRAWAAGGVEGQSTALLAPQLQLSKTALGLLASSTVRE